jgi:enoyl-CoA hydratase
MADVRVEQDGQVGIVLLDRPEARNALSPGLMAELAEAVETFDSDEGVHCIVLAGSDEVFAAGADIKAMAERTFQDVLNASTMAFWQRIGGCRTPMIAAVSGFALGGGCELALACDLRYASTRAKFGQPEVNLAVIPGWGGTQRLARVCGLAVAKDLVLTGRVVDADEAFRVGLVSALYEPDELLERVLGIARDLAAKSPLALAAAKVALNHALQGDHVENLAGEAKGFAGLFASEDQKEGMAAFIEKRDATFTGR